VRRPGSMLAVRNIGLEWKERRHKRPMSRLNQRATDKLWFDRMVFEVGLSCFACILWRTVRTMGAAWHQHPYEPLTGEDVSNAWQGHILGGWTRHDARREHSKNSGERARCIGAGLQQFCRHGGWCPLVSIYIGGRARELLAITANLEV
jgi:hypothetical protein